VDVVALMFGKRDSSDVEKTAALQERREAEVTYVALHDVESSFKDKRASAVMTLREAEGLLKQASKEAVLSGQISQDELCSILKTLGVENIVVEGGANLEKIKVASYRINPNHPIAVQAERIKTASRQIAAVDTVLVKIANDKKMCFDKARGIKKEAPLPAKEVKKVASAKPNWLKRAGTAVGLLEKVEKTVKPSHDEILHAALNTLKKRNPAMFQNMTVDHMKSVLESDVSKLHRPKGHNPLANKIREIMEHHKTIGTGEKTELEHKLTNPGKVLLGVGGVAGAHAIGHAHDKFVEKKDKNTAFKGMLKVRPDLLDKDQTTLRRHFDVLYKLSPTAATTPDIAGQWLASTTNYSSSGIDPVTAKQVVDLESAVNSGKSNKGRLSGALRGLNLVNFGD
jgi:hypothetical protein